MNDFDLLALQSQAASDPIPFARAMARFCLRDAERASGDVSPTEDGPDPAKSSFYTAMIAQLDRLRARAAAHTSKVEAIRSDGNLSAAGVREAVAKARESLALDVFLLDDAFDAARGNFLLEFPAPQSAPPSPEDLAIAQYGASILRFGEPAGAIEWLGSVKAPGAQRALFPVLSAFLSMRKAAPHAAAGSKLLAEWDRSSPAARAAARALELSAALEAGWRANVIRSLRDDE